MQKCSPLPKAIHRAGNDGVAAYFDIPGCRPEQVPQRRRGTAHVHRSGRHSSKQLGISREARRRVTLQSSALIAPVTLAMSLAA